VRIGGGIVAEKSAVCRLEHLVGLVEHHEAAVVQHQRVSGDEVEHPSDGSDDDVPSGPQLRLLRSDRGAAEHGHHVHAGMCPVGAQRLRHLYAELPRRRQHERLHLPLGGVDVLHDRQSEGGRLARARLRLADHVATLEQRRDRLFLNRARGLITHIPQRLECGLGEPEICEGLAHLAGSSSSLPVLRRSRRSIWACAA
jgi:hypothetical protein